MSLNNQAITTINPVINMPENVAVDDIGEDDSSYSTSAVKKTLNEKINICVKTSFIDKEKRTIEGWASKEDVDRFDELILASAFKKHLRTFMQNPVLLWGHDHDQPMGHIQELKIIPNEGLRYKAEFADTSKD